VIIKITFSAFAKANIKPFYVHALEYNLFILLCKGLKFEGHLFLKKKKIEGHHSHESKPYSHRNEVGT
jgi:hypothetical protein